MDGNIAIKIWPLPVSEQQRFPTKKEKKKKNKKGDYTDYLTFLMNPKKKNLGMKLFREILIKKLSFSSKLRASEFIFLMVEVELGKISVARYHAILIMYTS